MLVVGRCGIYLALVPLLHVLCALRNGPRTLLRRENAMESLRCSRFSAAATSASMDHPTGGFAPSWISNRGPQFLSWVRVKLFRWRLRILACFPLLLVRVPCATFFGRVCNFAQSRGLVKY